MEAGVLPHRLCEPLLAPEERPSKGGGVAMFAPMLLQDGEDFARGVDFVCPHGQHFLLGPTLLEARRRLQDLPWALARETTLPP